MTSPQNSGKEAFEFAEEAVDSGLRGDDAGGEAESGATAVGIEVGGAQGVDESARLVGCGDFEHDAAAATRVVARAEQREAQSIRAFEEGGGEFAVVREQGTRVLLSVPVQSGQGAGAGND
jgi:hypothetical protein